MKYITTLSLLFLSCILLNTIHSQEVDKELLALKDFYDNTNGDNWVNNEKWDGDDKCEFYGVHCNNENMVERIELDSNGLFGELTGDLLEKLDDLVSLNLAKNNITGVIPDNFFANGTAVNFETFDISHNFIGGEFPEIDYDIPLENLRIQNNEFSEGFENIFLIESLVEIDISNNDFEGEIPNEDLENLKDTLEILKFTGNSLCYNSDLNEEIAQKIIGYQCQPPKPTIELVDEGLSNTAAQFNLKYEEPEYPEITQIIAEWKAGATSERQIFTEQDTYIIGSGGTPLTPGTEYTITFTIENEIEQRTASEEIEFTTHDVPGVPQNFEINTDDPDSWLITWTEPENTGGVEITGYTGELRFKNENEEFETVETENVEETQVSIDISDREPGIYKVRIRARNQYGNGDWVESEEIESSSSTLTISFVTLLIVLATLLANF